VKASTSEGGTASQSWTVSPNGTVQVTDAITLWGPNGATAEPTISWSESYPAAAVVVPQADGQTVAIYGSGDSKGVLSFQNVPAGYFWLDLNGLAYYWTNSSNIDFGADVSEANLVAPSLPGGTSTTVFNLNFTGLDSTANPSLVGFDTVENSLGVQETVQDATSFSWRSSPTPPCISTNSFCASSYVIQADVSKIHDGFVLQEEPTSLGPLAGYTLGPAAILTGLSLQNNATNTINATLSHGAQVSLPLKIDVSAFTPLFDNVAPTVPTQTSSPFSLQAVPYVAGVNPPSGSTGITSIGSTCNSTTCTSSQTLATFGGPLPLGLFWPPPVATTTTMSSIFPGPVSGPLSCASGLSETVTYTGQMCGSATATCVESQGSVAPLLSGDTDFGTIQYSDPFPGAWQRVFNLCQQAALPLPSLTSTPNQPGQQQTNTWSCNLINSQSTASPSSPVVPLLSPVVNPTINGASLFTPATLNTRAITLSWSKPTLGTPHGYRVQAFAPQSLTELTGIVISVGARSTLYTAQTSVTYPPELLTSGVTYLFDITALMDAKANVETSPRRSGLPTAAANVVSAPITIRTSAP